MSHSTVSETVRMDILSEMLTQVPFEGWTDKTLRAAVSALDLPKGAEGLYFPGGVLEVIQFWSESCDALAEAKIKTFNLDEMRVRDKITEAVWQRLDAIKPHDLAGQRALARLALPDAMLKAAGGQANVLLWETAHMIWRAIGDLENNVLVLF